MSVRTALHQVSEGQRARYGERLADYAPLSGNAVAVPAREWLRAGADRAQRGRDRRIGRTGTSPTRRGTSRQAHVDAGKARLHERILEWQTTHQDDPEEGDDA